MAQLGGWHNWRMAQLGHASFGLFQKLAEEIDFGYYEAGSLEVCATEYFLKEAIQEADLLQTFGFEYRKLFTHQNRRLLAIQHQNLRTG